jgi:hypothetical protein
MPARESGWRRLVLAVAMLAFALQSYVTQTHIHYASVQAFGLSSADVFTPVAKDANGKAIPEKKSPANDDPANCPICQAVAHAGQFVTPTAIGFALPSETVVFIPLAIAALTARETASHNWQGRAPPRI